MDDFDHLIFPSALQHYAYCPRQFALIHIEQVWAENFFTAHGNLLHERVDSCEPEQRGNTRYERGVAVNSQQLQLTGKLDLLEIEGKPATQYFPVEYKRDKPKREDGDKIPLCAQALCNGLVCVILVSYSLFMSDAKDGVSIPIRGPVSIQSDFSVEPVSIHLQKFIGHYR